MESPSAPSPVTPAAPEPPRPAGLRGFLRGPRLADRRGFGFVVIIFLLVVVVFGVAYFAFVTTLRPVPAAPIGFDTAYMVQGNGTFNVSSDSNGSWTWTGFDVNVSINNVGSAAVPLAASGHNASLFIGTSTHKDAYHVLWIDRNGDGAVSVGDVFWITGNGAALPALSYVHFSLTWRTGGWTATEYFVTSSAIV